MGQLLRGMGPGVFADLLPWLLATLRSEGSSVERSGAAQGLAEALAVLGEGHLSEVRRSRANGQGGRLVRACMAHGTHRHHSRSWPENASLLPRSPLPVGSCCQRCWHQRARATRLCARATSRCSGALLR